jgi:pimeloyl-ACP methyl ester carboxylesterase
VSNVAYETDESERHERFRDIGLEEVWAIDCSSAGLTGLDAYVLRIDRDLVIAVRGSQEIADFITDLDLTKQVVGGVLVHRGFARSMSRLLDGFRDWQMAFGHEGSIWLTGHSLGGAIAQIAGYMLDQEGRNVAGVVTYGQPRVGGWFQWRNLVNESGFSERCERWVNRSDLVPRLPVVGLRPQNWSWVHAGRQHILDVDRGRVEEDDSSRLWPDRVIEGLGDHSMSGFESGDSSGYLRNLVRLMQADERHLVQRSAETRLRRVLMRCAKVTGTEPGNLVDAMPAKAVERSLGMAGIAYL